MNSSPSCRRSLSRIRPSRFPRFRQHRGGQVVRLGRSRMEFVRCVTDHCRYGRTKRFQNDCSTVWRTFPYLRFASCTDLYGPCLPSMEGAASHMVSWPLSTSWSAPSSEHGSSCGCGLIRAEGVCGALRRSMPNRLIWMAWMMGWRAYGTARRLRPYAPALLGSAARHGGKPGYAGQDYRFVERLT